MLNANKQTQELSKPVFMLSFKISLKNYEYTHPSPTPAKSYHVPTLYTPSWSLLASAVPDTWWRELTKRTVTLLNVHCRPQSLGMGDIMSLTSLKPYWQNLLMPWCTTHPIRLHDYTAATNETTEIRFNAKYFNKHVKKHEIKETLCFNPLKVSLNGILHALAAASKPQQAHTVAVCILIIICTFWSKAWNSMRLPSSGDKILAEC